MNRRMKSTYYQRPNKLKVQGIRQPHRKYYSKGGSPMHTDIKYHQNTSNSNNISRQKLKISFLQGSQNTNNNINNNDHNSNSQLQSFSNNGAFFSAQKEKSYYNSRNNSNPKINMNTSKRYFGQSQYHQQSSPYHPANSSFKNKSKIGLGQSSLYGWDINSKQLIGGSETQIKADIINSQIPHSQIQIQGVLNQKKKRGKTMNRKLENLDNSFQKQQGSSSSFALDSRKHSQGISKISNTQQTTQMKDLDPQEIHYKMVEYHQQSKKLIKN